jgi:hypothetical protein
MYCMFHKTNERSNILKAESAQEFQINYAESPIYGSSEGQQIWRLTSHKDNFAGITEYEMQNRGYPQRRNIKWAWHFIAYTAYIMLL